MTRVHVVGAAGYAAGELIRLLRNHPFVGLGVLESASHAGEPIGSHVPTLRTLARTFDPQDSASQAFAEDDVVVLAGGAELAHRQAPNFLEGGARVIDFSDAFRTDAASAGSLRAVYGFPERYRDALANARFVANPGCYPTAALLALLPLAPFASGINEYYAEQMWIPHITIAEGDVDLLVLPEIVRRFGERNFRWELRVTNFAVIRATEDVQEVCFRFDFGA